MANHANKVSLHQSIGFQLSNQFHIQDAKLQYSHALLYTSPIHFKEPNHLFILCCQRHLMFYFHRQDYSWQKQWALWELQTQIGTRESSSKRDNHKTNREKATNQWKSNQSAIMDAISKYLAPLHIAFSCFNRENQTNWSRYDPISNMFFMRLSPSLTSETVPIANNFTWWIVEWFNPRI